MNHSSSRSHTIFRITIKAVTNNLIRDYNRRHSKDNNESMIKDLDANRSYNFTDYSDNQDVSLEDIDKNKPFDINRSSVVTESHINFVDLAGSEKVSNHFINNDDDYTNFQDNMTTIEDSNTKNKYKTDRVKEGKAINKSLFF